MLPPPGKPFVIIPVSDNAVEMLSEISLKICERRQRLITSILELIMDAFVIADVPPHFYPDSKAMQVIYCRIGKILSDLGL